MSYKLSMPIVAYIFGSVGLLCFSFVGMAFTNWPFGPIWQAGLVASFVMHVAAGAGVFFLAECREQILLRHATSLFNGNALGLNMRAILCAGGVMVALSVLFLFIDIVDESQGRISQSEFIIAGGFSLIVLMLVASAVPTAMKDGRDKIRRTLRRIG